MSSRKTVSQYRSSYKKSLDATVSEKAKFWETKLYTQEEAGYEQAKEQQLKRWNYLQKVTPEVLKILKDAKLSPDGVHVGSILFSTEKGKIGGIKGSPIRNYSPYGEEKKQPMYILTDNDIDDFIHKEGRFVKAQCAGALGFTTLFWTHNYEHRGFESSPITILDLDSVEGAVDEKNWRKWIKKLVQYLSRKDYKTMILFTGNKWQIYLKPKNGMRSTYVEKRDKIIKSIAEKFKISMGNPNITTLNEWKIDPTIPFFIDYSAPNKPNAMERSPIASIHVLTGLVAVPVLPSRILTFKPEKEAHPIYVEKNIEKYLKSFRDFIL